MFYMKHSDSLIKSHLKEYYSKHIHLLPYAASSLRSVNIFIFDNRTKRYLEEPTNKHQFGFDSVNLVKFCEDSNTFLTTHRYIFCSPGTEIMLDQLTYNHLMNIYKKEDIQMPILTNIQGVPGCGKSTWIINNHKLGKDLVLCATKEGLADIKEKVTVRCARENMDFLKIKCNYKTISSYLINGSRKYETVFIDEYMMVHAGYIGLVAVLSECLKVYLLGDKNQIPYIDRLHHVHMQFSDANAFVANTEPLNITYRCPKDVSFALREFYPDITTKNSVKSSVEFYNLPSSISTIPVLDNTYYLTFTRAEKQLLSQLAIPESSKVMTIHEAQGLTSPNVICIRTNPQPLELFDSVPHAIVAISRHTRSFKYFSPVEKDKLHSIVAKAQSYTCIFGAGLSTTINSRVTPCKKSIKKALTGKCCIYYQNVNRMSSKASKFHNFVLKTKYPIYAICETSFHPGIHSSEFFPNDYVVYRCDRSNKTSKKKSGGGVLIAIHTSISNEEFKLSSSSVEHTCVKISMARKQNIFIYIAYIPSISRSELYAKCCDTIGDIYNAAEPSDIVLVIGDFNLPSTEWTFDKEINCCLPSNLTSDECLFVDSMLRCNLNQINHIPNVNGRMLDLIFTNELNIFSVSQSLAPFVLNDQHHIPMEILFDVREMSVKSNHQSNVMTYNFRKVNVTEFNQLMGNINWQDEFTDNINMSVNKFYDIMSRCFDRTVPLKRIQSNKNPPWYDNVLTNLKNLKTKAYQKMKKSNSETDKVAFIDINSKFESYFNISHENYIQNIEASIKSDPKTFWKYLTTKREVKGYPATMHLGESKSSSSQEIANMFAKFFQSTYKPEDIHDFNKTQTSINSSASITTPTICEEELIEAINHLGDGCGPDGIPSFMLKNHAELFAPPICILFNMSLRTGIFPTKWKSSKVTPIFKSGKRNDVSCYRGITTTSMIPKLFEIVVCKSFKSIIPSHLSNCQHGFIPGRSTTTNLVEFTSDIIKSIEQHQQVDTVYTDFSKAFDSISHCKALESLHSFGFSTDFVIWFYSYLSDRSQFIEIDGRRSNLIEASSGVPQGSHVGPWIFLIFINNIVNVVVNSSVLLFADDLKISKIIANEHDTTLLQDDINRINEWCEVNQLPLNINKCKVMSYHRKKSPITMVYTINGVNINRVGELKDLGVTFVGNMTFTKHVDLIIAKANSMFGFIRRWTKEIMDQRTLFILYFSYVRSQLEYAVQVWCPFYQDHIDRLESIQKQVLLFIMKKTDWDYDHDIPYYLNVARLPSYPIRCINYKIPTLENRRKLLGSTFIANVLLGKTDSSYILRNLNFYTPTRNLRQHSFLQPNQHRTNYGEHEPINAMAKMFNDVEELFDFSISSDCFKNRLKNHFL